ncbi:ABC transporter ATP-binding protein [Treponema phagedenis]|uniref:ABC transporter ATP-binding protein n=1 Tax=Treponema phagedenis TaxID=162 RepID=A0A0B7GUI8_TREPH|nr:ABC transporter ATP-binding protein [Treponema phagedenis]NVP23379.1 ABC transporter ATP-binding protein [Treponema phagedenis]QEJ95599.1 ABC transporter ATP-binding protein [Treponema phagedenis]QEJ98521.1 ABC transporter ATP-binding protein [Treponema phagedenis]QEK01452.1 ABC transporter ATP-binding protein [Treponema phagedenis]QEK04028.1 ABC transporter ATP-binding protein [Treponema phagedenis]
MNNQKTDEIILEVKNLRSWFWTDSGIVKAVDGVTFNLHKREMLAIVGESGSGKSVTNLAIMNLIPNPPGKIVGGEVWFNGKDILKMDKNEIRQLRGNKISMIFQDPMTSLNPFLKISTQMIETIRLHQGLSKKDSRDRAIEMLKLVGIPAAEKRVDSYPHQFSGGMRQRVMIAMALSCDPEILIADEPTSALDVTIQAQILDLIGDLSARLGTAVIMITHSLGLVAGMCDSVCVMYAGRIVEQGTVDELFTSPSHPYTQGLIKSVPRLDKENAERLFSITGQPPNVIDLPPCCPFYPRCNQVQERCKTAYPASHEFSAQHHASCWLYTDQAAAPSPEIPKKQASFAAAK